MREIKFRGKRVDNGQWVYGYYRAIDWSGEIYHQIINGNSFFRVRPITIGQFTGKYDYSDHTEVYEHDIVKEGGLVWEVIYDQDYCQFILKNRNGTSGFYLFHGQIIGNIFDTPEVLNAK